METGITVSLDVLYKTYLMKQECIPVGCVPPTHNCTGVSLTETPTPDRDPLDRNPPWTETAPGQRPPGQRPTGQRPRPVNRITDRRKNITLPQLRCGR